MSGLEIIGSIASVLQLAAAVYSISKTLYEVGDALSNAPSDIKDLARDLETFSEELHLLSSLLSDKTHRYSDRVYRLTAKIIGDCASICVRIDRILRKLRSGSFLARVKWVFKEKEIMKLLARLRDLKLSLMGTLSLLSALKADHMMDAMGVGHPSLLEAQKDERLSKETADEVEDTRKKLAGISADQSPDRSLSATLSETTLVPSVSQTSADTQHCLNLSGEYAELPHASPAFSPSTNSLTGTTSSNSSAVSRDIGQSNASIFISTIAVPPANSLMQLPQAMASVQSFYSALSRYENEDLEVSNTKNVINSDIALSPQVNAAKGLVQSSIEEWKADIKNSAMKRFGMTEEDARSWVSALPVPSIPSSDVLDTPAIPKQYPQFAPITAIEGGAAIELHPGYVTLPYDYSRKAFSFGGGKATQNATSSSFGARRHLTLRPLSSALVDDTGDDDDWGLGMGRHHVPTASTLKATHYETADGYNEDDSEFEATAGLEAMRIAEEQNAYTRGGKAFCTFEGTQSTNQQAQDESSNSDREYQSIDLGLVGGGYDAHMSYGDASAGMKTSHSNEMDGQSRRILIPDDLRTSDSYGEARGILRERSKERNPGQAAEAVKRERPMKNRRLGFVEERTVTPLSKVNLRNLTPEEEEESDDGLTIEYFDEPISSQVYRSQSTIALPKSVSESGSKAEHEGEEDDDEDERDQSSDLEFEVEATLERALDSDSVSSSADEKKEDSLPLVFEGNHEPGVPTRTLRRKGGETRLGAINLPGQWISDGECSDLSDYDIKRRLTKGPDERGASPRRYNRNNALGGTLRANPAASLPIEIHDTKEPDSIGTAAEAEYDTSLDHAKHAEILLGLTESAHAIKNIHPQTPSQFRDTAQRPRPSLALVDLNSVPEDEYGYVAASWWKKSKKGRRSAGFADSSIANASVGSIGDKERSKPPAATTPSILASNLSLTSGGDRGASMSASDDMGPPPQIPRQRAKPTALRLALFNTDPYRLSHPSKALQSLKSARSLTVLNSPVYPPNIIAPTRKGLRYEIEFLLQFQKVCTWMPSMEFESPTMALFRDGNRGHFGSIVARKRGDPNVDTVEIRGKTGGGGADLVTIGVDVISGARTRDHEFDKERSRSRSRSESPHSHAKLQIGLQLAAVAAAAAAAAGEYTRNRKVTVKSLGKGRTRTRSASSRRRPYSSYSSDEDRHSGSHYATIRRYGVGPEKVAEQAELDHERNSIRGPEREHERTKAAILYRERERDRDHSSKGESARLGPQRQDRNWELERHDRVSEDAWFAENPLERVDFGIERYSREADYYDHHKTPRQPIVIRQEGQGPMQLLDWDLDESVKQTQEEDEYYYRREFGDFAERSRSPTTAGIELKGIGLGTAATAGLYENRKRKRGDSAAEEKSSPLSSYESSITGPPSVPLTAEVFRTQQRRQASSGPSTTSSRSPDESDDRKSTDGEKVAIKVTGTASTVVGEMSLQRSSSVEPHESEDLQIPEALDTNSLHRTRLNHIRKPDTMPLRVSASILIARPSGSPIRQKAPEDIQDLEAEPLLLDMSEISSDGNQKSTDGPRHGNSGLDTQRESFSSEPFQLDPLRIWSSSISEKHSDLWIRAFAQLQNHDSDSSQNIWVAWAAAHSYLPSLATSKDSMASMIATRLGSVINLTRTQLLESSTELSRSTASCIDNFAKILNVMQETLNFKTGAFIWTCLCTAEKGKLEDLSTTQILSNSHALADLSEIATLVARYNVLESMYQQWPGMSLEKMYEKSLVGLCINVLKYLDLVLSHPAALEQKEFEQRREAQMASIRSADIACRGFSVTIVNDDESAGKENKVEDVSTDEEDSDATEKGEDTYL